MARIARVVVPYYPHHVTQRKLMLERVDHWIDYLSINDEKRLSLIRKHQRTGRPLGNDLFIQKVETLTGRSIRPGKPGPKTKMKVT